MKGAGFGFQVNCKIKTKIRIKFFFVVVALAMRSVHFTTNLMTPFCRGACDAKFSTIRVSGGCADFIPESLPALITQAWLADVGKVKSLSPVLVISVTKQVNDFSCFVIRVDEH